MGIFNFSKDGNSPSINLDNIKFVSSDHKRYENGTHVSGPHPNGAKRGIEIKKNPITKGYLVTMHNLDGIHPMWGNNIQMATKQMEIISSTSDKTIIRGWGYDPMGNPFSGYGLTIFHNNKTIERIILHMYVRKIEIEYFK